MSIGYKGFQRGLVCQPDPSEPPFQFVEGETYTHEGEVKLCQQGFHYCEAPLDVLRYYEPATSVYHVVEVDRVSKQTHPEDSKRVAGQLTVGPEIGIPGLVKAHVEYVTERANNQKDSNSGAYGIASNSGTGGVAANFGTGGVAANSGWYGAASNSGTGGAASNSGDYGVASNSGTGGAAANSGDYGAASNSGTGGAAANFGTGGVAANSGWYGAASNSGTGGAAANSGAGGVAANFGTGGAAANFGTGGAASTEGAESVAISVGSNSRAKGSLNCWLVLTDRDAWTGKIRDMRAVRVDGNQVKADTFYQLVDGQIVEVAS